MDMVRSMMSAATLPVSFWGYTLETAAFMLNCVPSKSMEKTPYELWFGRVPPLSFLKIWGCEAFVRKDRTSGKLDSRSDKYFFVGYPKETMGYYFFHRGENKVIVARHGVFLEKEFLARKSSGSNVQLEEIQEELQDGNPRVPPRVAGVSGSFLSPDPSRMEEAEDIPAETQVNTPSTPVEEVQARVDEEVPLQDVHEPQPEEAPQPPPVVIPRR